MNAPLTFEVYGLRLRALHPIPGLLPQPLSPPPDFDIRFGELPFAVEGEDRIRRRGSRIAFDYEDDTRFVIDLEARTIHATWPPPLTDADAATYLLGPVLALLLRIRGTLSLHASAVACGDQAILLAGAAGSGKSTTAAAFAEIGWEVLTDDVAAIDWRDGRPHVLPGYPRLRLWPDAARAVANEELPPLTPNWEKRYYDLARASRFRSTPAPLAAIYLLADRADAADIRPLSGHEAALALISRTSMNLHLDRAMREAELADVARLVERVPLFEVTARADLQSVDDLCAMIAASHAHR